VRCYRAESDDDEATESGSAKFALLCVLGGVELRSAFGARAVVPVLALRAPCAGGSGVLCDVGASVL
jgi:hypothetical protein